MRNSKHRLRFARRPSVETLEVRQVMSADPLSGALSHHVIDDSPDAEIGLVHHTLPPPDFWIDDRDLYDIEQSFDNIEKMLSSAHNLTGWNQVQSNFGFKGTGQTVAVIDSGIAYDHWALGGGLGSNYRVVGGWDFTEENDGNPFDDGPNGSHGTHVAGIIGSSSTTNSGVAPEVDLVGLRVFNDADQGYFSWVENALQWVLTNRTAFENPITAVNLSIGTSWNSTSLPSWAMLEDEFAALKAAGVFIAVSAGNDYASYNEPGLSYPAASPYVVPVMSVTDSGSLASYSQRHTSAIGAPGHGIVSTVPDYAGNHNSVTDDFASKSGTSMAAPYVAGASVLIRQAMEFVGYSNITQDTIYSHMRATADAIGTTGYLRLNLGNAIDALIPDDEYGSTVATAYNMGTVGSSTQIAGMINSLTDSDYFRFTAGATGTISFTANLSHGQAANWLVSGLNGWTSGSGNQTYNFEVAAGQTYTIGLTSAGLSNFTLDVAVENSVSFTDWGTVNQKWINNVSQSGEKLYRVQTTQVGYLTAEAYYAGSGITLAWLNESMQQVAAGSGIAGGQRTDHYAAAGQIYYLRVSGANSDLDFRLTNLVSVSGSTATVVGTSLADTFYFSTDAKHVAVVNGVEYQFNKGAVTSLQFNGGAGSDTITLTGTSGNETATIQVGSAQLTGSGFAVAASNTENITVYGNGGNDSVTLYGSNGDDLYSLWSDRARMTGGGYLSEARHFNATLAYAQGGYDRAHLYDTAADENYIAWWDRALLTGPGGASHEARGFDRTIAKATAGNDTATLVDTTGNDVFSAWWDHAVMYGSGYFNDTAGFTTVVGHSTAGDDQAFLYDSAGDDRYFAWSNRAKMTGYGFTNEAFNFDKTYGFATIGYDRANLHDSAGNDTYSAWSDRVHMSGSGYANEARGFDRTNTRSSAGIDVAHFYDTAGDDIFSAWWDHAVMYGSGFFNDSTGFRSTVAYASTGMDRAFLNDSAGDDTYSAWWNRALLSGASFYIDARGFDRTMAKASTGNDQATFYDSPGNDVFSAWPDHAVLYGNGFFNDSFGFKSTLAHSSGGADQAFLYDSSGNDLFETWSNRSLMSGTGYTIDARNFRRSVGFATGGDDRAAMYDSAASDWVHSELWGAYMTDYAIYTNEARGFDRVEARRVAGGADRAFLSTVDYVFELIGVWSL